MPEKLRAQNTERRAQATTVTSKTNQKEKKEDRRWLAVIETGGKQYKVVSGQALKIEKIRGAHKQGDKIVFDKILLLEEGKSLSIGTPYIDGAKVQAVIERISRDRKITVIKYKAKSRYFKKRGHRQPYFQVRILSVR